MTKDQKLDMYSVRCKCGAVLQMDATESEHKCQKGTGSSGEPLVTAELADLIQDADALRVLDRAITNGDTRVVKYCAQVLRARLSACT